MVKNKFSSDENTKTSHHIVRIKICERSLNNLKMFATGKKNIDSFVWVEDTYSSEETVDQQPVLVKVMDTADQVQIKNRIFTTDLKLGC